MGKKLTISALALAAGIGHMLYPQVEIDLVTLAMLVIALLPWFSSIVKSLELPGGFKIELQDVQRATERVAGSAAISLPVGVTARGEVSTGSPGGEPPERAGSAGLDDRMAFLTTLSRQDPNLGMVALRIEIERMLRNIARNQNLSWEGKSAGGLLRELERASVLPRQIVGGLREMIDFGNRAAHGADVSRDAVEWAIGQAPAVLDSLTAYLGD